MFHGCKTLVTPSDETPYYAVPEVTFSLYDSTTHGWRSTLVIRDSKVLRHLSLRQDLDYQNLYNI